MHRIALAALLLTACSDGVVPRAAPTPSATQAPPASLPPTSPAPRPPATRPAPTGVHVPGNYPPARGDVDGDGRADTATIVESGPRDDPDWRFGVRLAMTSAGTRTVWAEEGDGGMDAQQVAGIADVDADGRGEAVVNVGTSATAGYYQLVTLSGDRPRFVRDLLVEGFADGVRGWGCRDGLVYTTVTRRGRGTITWYRLAGTRLVRVRAETRRWRAGTKPPAPFGERPVRCGAVR